MRTDWYETYLQNRFESKNIEFFHPNQIDNMSSPKSQERLGSLDKEYFWECVKNRLTEYQYSTIKLMFVERKNYAQIGKQFGVTGQCPKLLVEKSIRKLKNKELLETFKEFI